jgi:hypothetical protein
MRRPTPESEPKPICTPASWSVLRCLYLAWQNREFRKFLAGAFFVSSGILFYLYLADVSVPLLGTNFVETPQISGGRSIVHFILFLLCFYFGFVRKVTS